MANRTTVKSNIVTLNVPSVTNTIMNQMLNSELADNIRFREDVAVAQSSGSSAITVDFTGKDRVDLTRTGGSLAITVTGIGDGEEKFLLITKTAGQPITFVGVTDVTPVISGVTADSTVIYQIIRKGAVYVAKAWLDTVTGAINAINAKNPDGLITAPAIAFSWDMDTVAFITVAHGIADQTKIKEVHCFIRANAGAVTNLLQLGAGNYSWFNTNVSLFRTAGGAYDNILFNAATGWIIVKYLP
jgi:hypothetical protein